MRPTRPAARLAASLALAAALAATGCPASGCRYDTDCPGAEVCTAGTCQQSPAVAVAAGGRCTPGIPCAEGEVCVAGVCQAQGSQVSQPCTSDQDPSACPSGKLCTVSTEVATCPKAPCTALNACTAPAGLVAPGRSCTADADCASGWCQDGVCAAVCATDADCQGGDACTALTATPPGGVAATVHLCRPGPGTPTPCDGDRFCPGGGVCTFDFGPPVTTRCVPASSHTVPTGESCSFSTPCAGTACLNQVNVCAAPCLDSSDCPVGMSCGTINFTSGTKTTPEPGCIVPLNGCLASRMCASRPGKTCRLSVSIDNRHLLLDCASTAGAPPGASCTTGSDCATNLCLPTGVCSQPCLDDGDCRCATGGSCDGTCTTACTLTGWTCGTVDEPVPAGGTETVRACTPP